MSNPTLRTRALAPLAALTLLALAPSCKKPEPPQLAVLGAKVTKVDLRGIEVTVHVAATNPNSFPMKFQSVTANIVLAGRYPLGQSSISQPVSIPAHETTNVDVPMLTPWNDLATLGILAASNEAVPYTVNGTFGVGGEKLQLAIPFSAQGVITHDLLVAAALESSGIPFLKK